MKILISRTDRAGDLILTLPLFILLKKLYPKSVLYCHLRSYTLPLINDFSYIDKTVVDENFTTVFSLAKCIKKEKVDVAIIVHPSFKAIFATWLAGVKMRIGRASNLWQIMLNIRLLQKRSRNLKHELEYNLDLLLPLFSKFRSYSDICDSFDSNFSPEKILSAFYENLCNLKEGWLKVSERYVIKAKDILCKSGLKDTDKLVVIHPTHGGSAINMSIGKYREIIEKLIEIDNDIIVVVTLGKNEQNVIYNLPPPIEGKYTILTDIYDLAEYMGIVYHSKVFVGGSTGPTHIASAMGKNTIALYPLLPSTTYKRWGPIGKNVIIITPTNIECMKNCKICKYYNCMNLIDTKMLVEKIYDLFRKQAY